MCPSSSNFPQRGSKKKKKKILCELFLSTCCQEEVTRLWMLKYFKVHCIMTQFALWLFSLMVPDVQTLLSSIFNPFRTQTTAFVLVLHSLSRRNFMVSTPTPLNQLPKSLFRVGCFSRKLIVKLHDRDGKFSQVTGNLCPPPAPPPSARSVNTSGFEPQVRQVLFQ